MNWKKILVVWILRNPSLGESLLWVIWLRLPYISGEKIGGETMRHAQVAFVGVEVLVGGRG